MKGKTHVPDLDTLSKYDRDDLHQLVFVAREMPVELEPVNHFDPVVLECWWLEEHYQLYSK
jgi:hypothetical protein